MPDERQLDQLLSRIARLEQRVSDLESQSKAANSSEAEALESRFGLTFINRIGAVTIAIGIVLLFKYAADSNWISPSAGIVLGLIVGIALLGAAEWLRRRNDLVFAQGVAGCGLAIVYIAFYAAHAYYHLTGLATAVAAIALAAVLGFVVSFRFGYAFLIPWNAFLAICAFAALLDNEHPTMFAVFAFLLSAAHFALYQRKSKAIYLTGHACFLIAALRMVTLWAEPYTAPVDRWNTISELYSVLLAAYGIVMIIAGLARRAWVDRLLGLTLLGLVIVKLYLYDVWLLTRFYRISAFVALGALLLGASYLYSRFRATLDVLLAGRTETPQSLKR